MIRTALFLALLAGATMPLSAEDGSGGFQWGVKIPLRDGVRLNATLYRPPAGTQQPACVFTLTPYISQTYHERGQYFSEHGYAFLTIDARGRGNSEGEFDPLRQEVEDVRDVVDWLARQPYCNGRVSMWGGSYAGYNQWLAAKWRQPALRSIVPVAAPWPGLDFPARNNIGMAYAMMWLTFTAGHTSQEAIFRDPAFRRARLAEWWASGRPFAELDVAIGHPSAVFRRWVEHPAEDAYWDGFLPSPAEFGAIDLPVLTITGQYDFGNDALAYYKTHMRLASDAAKARHYLVIGPWNHPGTRTPTREIGGVDLGEASLLDLNALHKAWYDWTLKGGAKPEFLKNRVAFYVLGKGAEDWRYADTLESITAGNRPFYLDSDRGRANEVFASGRLDPEAPPGGEPDSYVYDPRLPGPPVSLFDPGFMSSQSLAMQAHGRQMLIYHSAPFAQATSVAGFFRFDAWLELDQPDTDITAWLYEVHPDGTATFLGYDQVRARYRENRREAKLVTPGAIERYVFDRFQFVARRLELGSRLRLMVIPSGAALERNHNSGGVVARETRADARTVTVRLHHDRSHRSALHVPIASPPAP